jgi:Flp pilus assembly pilin Flp
VFTFWPEWCSASFRNAVQLGRNRQQDEQGQDLIEYTLLMAFVALASAALFIGAGGSIKGIWSVTNSQLAAASTSAS